MVITRLQMILTVEELGRINVIQNADEGLTIITDVHGMTCVKARKFINNIINVVREKFRLIVIHGYVHGTAIKAMLTKYSNCHVCRKYTDSYNYGVTHMLIAP